MIVDVLEGAVQRVALLHVEPQVGCPLFFSDKTAGFVERQQYSAAGFTKTGQNVVNYEFSDMQSLLALMNGRTFLNIVETLKPLCTEWQTVMLSPGDYSGAYFLGKGADPK